jgi:hypothetical protein
MVDGPSLESSAHGRIEQILLTIPSWVLRYQRQVEICGTSAVYRNVFAALNSSVRFTVLTHEEGVPLLGDWLQELGVQGRTVVIPIANRAKLSIWAEDAFTVCLDRAGQRWVLDPFSDSDADVPWVAKIVAEHNGWNHLEIPKHLQSGNILVGDDFWLVGGDALQDSPVLEIDDATRQRIPVASRVQVPGFDGSFEELEVAHDEGARREYRYRGNSTGTVQPVFHIDTFVTLAGERARRTLSCIGR